MPGITNWISTPLAVIKGIFEKTEDNRLSKVEEYFSKLLSSEEGLSSVPSLNDVALHQLKTNTLVRYRCMIQDMYDPEYFLGLYDVRNEQTGEVSNRLGMFQDIAHCEPSEEILMTSPGSKRMDRQTFYCVPIPGENSWTKQCFAERNVSVETPSSTNGHQRQKRSRESDECDMTTEPTSQQMETGATEKMDINDTEPKADQGGVKKTKTDANGKASSLPSHDLNFPLPNELGPPCQVKVYETENSFKLNEMVEFVGILSIDPAMVDFPEDLGDNPMLQAVGDFELAEQQVRSPPPSLVPRLHVLTSRLLTHSNPLLPAKINDESVLQKDVQSVLSEAAETRAALLELLQQLLFGDNLAAEYLLCHLLSTVYTRLDDVVAVGKFALNISGCPKDSSFVEKLFEVLNRLLVKSHYLPMTVECLNTTKFTPQKDYERNRLTSGVLQLSNNTNLVVDETAMQAGQLDATGVKNLMSIGNLISWQKVEYDFNFHKQDFISNINVLVLSEGKSMIKCDCQCPLSSENCSDEALTRRFLALQQQLTEAVQTRFRRYLGLIQQLPYDALPDDLQKDIENDFVECRKVSKENMTTDDLHALLTLARLISISYGKATLTKEMWEKAKSLEFARKKRFSAIPQTA